MSQKMSKSTEQYVAELRGATERWWQATRRGVQSASSRAGQYRLRVEQKRDLYTLGRRIQERYRALGRAVFQAHQEAPATALPSNPEVAGLLEELVELSRREAGLHQATRPGADATARGPRPEEEEDRHL